MKITDAWIFDPSLQGQIALPELCIQVDEVPDVTIPPETFGPWTVGKYGPFVKYAKQDESVTAVDFNLHFRGRFPMVIDVVLVVDNGHDTSEVLEMPFSLPLSRARQLVKKYDPDWRLLVSDREAVTGNLIWRPVESNPECRGQGGFCKVRPSHPVRIKGVEVPLCIDCTRKHNAAQAHARTASSSR